jgi:transposase-like protein
MLITIEIKRPHCHSPNNQKREKNKGKQNYLCKEYRRQFISEHERTCKGTLSWVKNMFNHYRLKRVDCFCGLKPHEKAKAF